MSNNRNELSIKKAGHFASWCALKKLENLQRAAAKWMLNVQFLGVAAKTNGDYYSRLKPPALGCCRIDTLVFIILKNLIYESKFKAARIFINCFIISALKYLLVTLSPWLNYIYLPTWLTVWFTDPLAPLLINVE